MVWHFPEILKLAHGCKFLNCLHLVEHGCNVLHNIEKISSERFHSYCAIVADAQAEYRARKEASQKIETSVKAVGGRGNAKQVPKLNSKFRHISRRRDRQRVLSLDLEDEPASDQELDQQEALD